MKGGTCRERLGGGSALRECAGMARWAVLASVALALSLPVLGNSASHYEVLGLTPSATTEDVRRAYKKLARKYHPDKVRPHCVVQPAVQRRRASFNFRCAEHGGRCAGTVHRDQRRSPGAERC